MNPGSLVPELMAVVEPSAPTNSYVAVLAPSSSEYDLIWKKDHQRCKELSEDEVVLELGTKSGTQGRWCEETQGRDSQEILRSLFSEGTYPTATWTLDFWPPEL